MATIPDNKEWIINQAIPRDIPALPSEQEARIRAFINMLLDRVEVEQKSGIVRGEHD